MNPETNTNNTIQQESLITKDSKLNNFVAKVKTSLVKIDDQFKKIIPDNKLRIIVYSTVSFFIVLIGLLIVVALNRQVGTTTNKSLFNLGKPRIETQTAKPERNLTENEKSLNLLMQRIREIKTPPSDVTEPSILMDIKI